MQHSRPIKVLYIQIPPGGGSLIALFELVKHIDKRLVEPVILCYYRNKFTKVLETLSGCRVIYFFEDLESPVIPSAGESYGRLINYMRLQIASLKNIFFSQKQDVRKIYDIIKKENPDIVHHNNDILVNRNCIRAARKARVNQVVHNRSLAGYGHDLVSFLYDSRLIRKVSFQINITKAVSDHFNKLFRAFSKKSAVISDIVDVERYRPASAKTSLKSEFGITSNEYVITSIGRLTQWKGQHVLIDAVDKLRNQFSNIKVLLVGPDENGVGSKLYAGQLKDTVRSLGLQDKIIFTGNRNDIPEIINTSDVIVHTSVKPEPQGLVIIEALLCKKPVIAVDTFGSGELINKYGGIAVKPGDAEALASLLKQKLLNNGTTNGSVNETGYRKLRDDFDPLKQVNAIMEVYQKVAEI